MHTSALEERNERRVHFSGFKVVYDEERYDYPIDDEGRIYAPLEPKSVHDKSPKMGSTIKIFRAIVATANAITLSDFI